MAHVVQRSSSTNLKVEAPKRPAAEQRPTCEMNKLELTGLVGSTRAKRPTDLDAILEVVNASDSKAAAALESYAATASRPNRNVVRRTPVAGVAVSGMAPLQSPARREQLAVGTVDVPLPSDPVVAPPVVAAPVVAAPVVAAPVVMQAAPPVAVAPPPASVVVQEQVLPQIPQPVSQPFVMQEDTSVFDESMRLTPSRRPFAIITGLVVSLAALAVCLDALFF